ncbi:MAG: 3-hydroxyacyl-ACP dehydratase [Ferruginibacter sp.]
METGTIDILTLIPQRPPFVMVDTLLASGEQSARTGFTVRADNILVENGRLLEAGLTENIAQTAAARSGYQALQSGQPSPVGYIGAIKNLEITERPAVGDVLMTEIIIENQVFDITLISGKVYRNEQLLAQCQMKIFINNHTKPSQS